MISWWCTAQEEPWTWSWAAYPGIWIATLLPVFFYGRAVTKHPDSVDWRRFALFMTGMVVFWLASDWPLGPLGAGYLASAHMTQFLLYKPVVWLGRNVIAAGIIYNVLLLATHAPGSVEALRQSQLGSFGMDVLWMVAGFILWLPVISPLPEGRTEAPWAKMLYLFVATSVVAVIPASYLTFTTTPIYAIYELAPRVGTITALEDQQVAGIIMKIGTIPIVWGTIAVLWFRWANREALAA